jgi:hypothetical protein
MNVKELTETLNLLPDDAKVYIEADHGQQAETAHNILAYYGKRKLDYYGDELGWEEFCSAIPDDEVKAVLISY